MIKFLAVVCALMGSRSVALKVSVRFTACENYMSKKIVSIMEPEGCLHIHYPERGGNDVAILTQGVSEDGSYIWDAPLDRTPENSLKIRSDDESMQITFYNHHTEKEQTIKNLENGEEFEINDNIMPEEAKSRSLEEVTRFYDETNDVNGRSLKLYPRKACGDRYNLQTICPSWKRRGGCKYVNIRRLCAKSCGACDTTTPPQCPATSTAAPIECPAVSTPAKPVCTTLPLPTTTCTTPIKNTPSKWV